MDPIEQLTTPAGWALLSELPPYDGAKSLALGTALRAAGFDADLVAAALTQSRLRAKAQAKFGDLAFDMLFTQAGLEQSTRLSVAARHAHRLRASGATFVADLGCGIGADALAMAGMDLRVLAVDLDPTTAGIARFNLRQFPEATVLTGDALDLASTQLDGIDAIWADPARRTAQGRLHRLEDYSPHPMRLLELRRRIPRLGMKLGPALPHQQIPSDAQAQWLSVAGEVVEVALWFGETAPEGPGRTAVVVAPDGSSAVVSQGGDPSSAVVPAPTGPLGPYLLEPDGAVIRAGLLHLLAAELDAHLIDPTIAYLTCDSPRLTPLADTFRVLDRFPFSLKRLRGYLRERGIGRLEIKKRGSALDPAKLRTQLALRGDAGATIVLTRIENAPQVLVVERMPRSAGVSA